MTNEDPFCKDRDKHFLSIIKHEHQCIAAVDAANSMCKRADIDTSSAMSAMSKSQVSTNYYDDFDTGDFDESNRSNVF